MYDFDVSHAEKSYRALLASLGNMITILTHIRNSPYSDLNAIWLLAY